MYVVKLNHYFPHCKIMNKRKQPDKIPGTIRLKELFVFKYVKLQKHWKKPPIFSLSESLLTQMS